MEFNRLYAYYKKKLSFNQNLTGLFIKLGLNSIFGILIYFSIDILYVYQDKIFLLLLVAVFVMISFLVELTWENKELGKLKKKEKIYAQDFIELNHEYQEALKNIKARDEFLSIVSHELKTPLTVMLLKLHSELNNIKNASLAKFSVHELMEVLKNSEKQIKRLTIMINDLLDVSLITTGRMDLQLTDTDLVKITKQVSMSFSEVLKKEKYKVKITAKSPVSGKWDKVRIEQVITNLFSNAIKYGGGKPIDIQILKSWGSAKFIIKDRGMGIAASDQKVVFDLFRRSSGNSEHKNGLGVGLFISSQIVKMHGGNIKVTSTPVRGTNFTIELPLKRS
ncbi:hypothetical protein A3B39_00120 [Candidatus Daviesbacteria bacterium RIFCSPLOWO2_01_FULL_37_10]|nr:MAG: hypothetical protein A3B39_00120 [Candidatus Daviesbacteria bacterium RIFCSPLOWO2_01_FULL_37_10]